MFKTISPRACFAITLIVISLFVLETARSGVTISKHMTGTTPVTTYQKQNAAGPVVVIAHGFAGSQQMMQGYALPLARAGYRVHVFEFLGHGQHTIPMSGDVTSVDGTTRLLVDQTTQVIDSVTNGAVALIGHSMATDILVRAAKDRTDIGPIVLVSAFSELIDATSPPNLLLISGAWENGLRGLALDTLKMVNPDAAEGETIQNGQVTRRAVAAPFSEHVSVLQSQTARNETLTWLDQTYGHTSDVPVLPTGWAILGLMIGLVLGFRAIAKTLPKTQSVAAALNRQQTALILIAPTLAAPLIALALDPRILPVLVADYLGLHLLIFGSIQLSFMRFFGMPIGSMSWRGIALALVWCAAFGLMLDRYAANFWPTPQRFGIIAVMLLGAVPYMVADMVLTKGVSVFRRLYIRAAFFASLGIALALDFERLFFLALIAPVLVLFFVIYGTIGRDISRRVGPLSAGLALGIALAWAIGVSFPLFQA